LPGFVNLYSSQLGSKKFTTLAEALAACKQVKAGGVTMDNGKRSSAPPTYTVRKSTTVTARGESWHERAWVFGKDFTTINGFAVAPPAASARTGTQVAQSPVVLMFDGASSSWQIAQLENDGGAGAGAMQVLASVASSLESPELIVTAWDVVTGDGDVDGDGDGASTTATQQLQVVVVGAARLVVAGGGPEVDGVYCQKPADQQQGARPVYLRVARSDADADAETDADEGQSKDKRQGKKGQQSKSQQAGAGGKGLVADGAPSTGSGAAAALPKTNEATWASRRR
jgi:hypothetical protein